MSQVRRGLASSTCPYVYTANDFTEQGKAEIALSRRQSGPARKTEAAVSVEGTIDRCFGLDGSLAREVRKGEGQGTMCQEFATTYCM